MICFERSTRTVVLLLVAISALTSPAPLEAQGSANAPTFLAIPESYPNVDGPVVVLREPGRNIILLRESEASPEALHIGLTLLGRLEERTPLRPGLAHMSPVTGFHLRTPLAAWRYAELEELLERLRARPLTSIGNLGFGRSMPLVSGGG